MQTLLCSLFVTSEAVEITSLVDCAGRGRVLGLSNSLAFLQDHVLLGAKSHTDSENSCCTCNSRQEEKCLYLAKSEANLTCSLAMIGDKFIHLHLSRAKANTVVLDRRPL